MRSAKQPRWFGGKKECRFALVAEKSRYVFLTLSYRNFAEGRVERSFQPPESHELGTIPEVAQ